jgi:hypothetical protein
VLNAVLPKEPCAFIRDAKPNAQLSITPTREQLIERIEYLWSESIDGIEASKESLTIHKPDGTCVEVPPDLRARAGFIREARSVLELQGEASGHLIRGQPVSSQVIIVVPAKISNEHGHASDSDEPPGVAIDVVSSRF